MATIMRWQRGIVWATYWRFLMVFAKMHEFNNLKIDLKKSTKPWHYEQYHQQHPERFFVLLGGGYMSNFTIVVNWCHKNCSLQSVKLCKWHPESNKHNSARQKLPPTDPIVSQTARLDSVWCSLTKSWNCPSPLFHSLGHFTLRNPGPCP
jgi:hypothetical protein